MTSFWLLSTCMVTYPQCIYAYSLVITSEIVLELPWLLWDLSQFHSNMNVEGWFIVTQWRYYPVNTTSWCPRRLGMDKVLWTSLCRLRMNGHGNDFMETCAMRDDNHKPALTTKQCRGNFQPIRLTESKESHQVSMTFCLKFELVWTLRFLKIVCSNVILTLPKRH